MESLLVEEEMWSYHYWIKAQGGRNFWSDPWIALKFLHEFPEAVLLVVPMESLLVEKEVWSCHTWKKD